MVYGVPVGRRGDQFFLAERMHRRHSAHGEASVSKKTPLPGVALPTVDWRGRSSGAGVFERVKGKHRCENRPPPAFVLP